MYPRRLVGSAMPISPSTKAKSRESGALDTKATRAGMAFAMMVIPFVSFGFIVMVLLIAKA